jgi:hypothetical protein
VAVAQLAESRYRCVIAQEFACGVSELALFFRGYE